MQCEASDHILPTLWTVIARVVDVSGSPSLEERTGIIGYHHGTSRTPLDTWSCQRGYCRRILRLHVPKDGINPMSRLQRRRDALSMVGADEETLCFPFGYHGSCHQCEAFTFPEKLGVPRCENSTLLRAVKLDVETSRASDGCEKRLSLLDVKSSTVGKFRLRLPLAFVDLFGVLDFATPRPDILIARISRRQSPHIEFAP